MVRAREHEQARAVLARAPLEHLARLAAQPRVEVGERRVSCVDGVRRLRGRQPGHHVAQSLEELLGHQPRLVERDERRRVGDARLGEDVALLEEPGLDVLRRGHDARTRERPGHVAAHERGQRVDHRGEEDVELLLLAEEQLAVVARDALDGIAAVHGAAALAELAALLFRRVGREDDVARVHAERAEQAHPELVGGPEVQNARDADAEASARRRRRRPGGTRPCEPSRQR